MYAPPVGRAGKVEVVQNPTSKDIRDFNKEVNKQYPDRFSGDPALRFTQDADGNRYMWKSYEGDHGRIEPWLKQKLGVDVNQNAQRDSHRLLVRRAMANGEQIPKSVQADYPELFKK